MGGAYYTDILICLYDQGALDRSRWVQEAGNIVLADISKTKYEPPRQTNISLRKTQKAYKNIIKNNFDLNGPFRGAF